MHQESFDSPLEIICKLGFCFRPAVTATDTGLLLAWAVAVRTQGKYRAAEDEAAASVRVTGAVKGEVSAAKETQRFAAEETGFTFICPPAGFEPAESGAAEKAAEVRAAEFGTAECGPAECRDAAAEAAAEGGASTKGELAAEGEAVPWRAAG